MNITYMPMNFSSLSATRLGQKIWEVLTRDKSIVAMKALAEVRRLPVEAVSRALLDECGDEVRQDRVKQMIGHMIRQVMEAAGYEIDVQNRPVLFGGLFSKATRYKRAGKPKSENAASASGVSSEELR